MRAGRLLQTLETPDLKPKTQRLLWLPTAPTSGAFPCYENLRKTPIGNQRDNHEVLMTLWSFWPTTWLLASSETYKQVISPINRQDLSCRDHFQKWRPCGDMSPIYHRPQPGFHSSIGTVQWPPQLLSPTSPSKGLCRSLWSSTSPEDVCLVWNGSALW